MTKETRLSNLSFILLAIVILLCVNWLWQSDSQADQMEYSQVRQLFLQEKVESFSIDSGGTLTMELRGRNLVTGLPKTIVVTSDETLEALREPALQIVDAVHNVLERTPPELAADIFDRGIVMTGGGSLLSGLDALIEEKTGISTMIAEDPLTAVAIGTGKFIEFAHGMGRSLEGGDKDEY